MMPTLPASQPCFGSHRRAVKCFVSMETGVDGHHHEGTELSGQCRVSRRGRKGPEGEVVGTGQPPTQAAISHLAPPGGLGSARLWPASEPFCCLSAGDRRGDGPPSSPQMLGVSPRYVLRSLSQNLGLIPCTWPRKLSWDLSLTPGHFLHSWPSPVNSVSFSTKPMA